MNAYDISILESLGSSLGRDINYPNIYLSSYPPGKCRESALKQITTATCKVPSS
jgi:hypothetical protein